MNGLAERDIHCPYCGERIGVLVDCSVQHQNYIEDCQVCCQAINFDVTIDAAGQPFISVSNNNE